MLIDWNQARDALDEAQVVIVNRKDRSARVAGRLLYPAYFTLGKKAYFIEGSCFTVEGMMDLLPRLKKLKIALVGVHELTSGVRKFHEEGLFCEITVKISDSIGRDSKESSPIPQYYVGGLLHSKHYSHVEAVVEYLHEYKIYPEYFQGSWKIGGYDVPIPYCLIHAHQDDQPTNLDVNAPHNRFVKAICEAKGIKEYRLNFSKHLSLEENLAHSHPIEDQYDPGKQAGSPPIQHIRSLSKQLSSGSIEQRLEALGIDTQRCQSPVLNLGGEKHTIADLFYHKYPQSLDECLSQSLEFLFAVDWIRVYETKPHFLMPAILYSISSKDLLISTSNLNEVSSNMIHYKERFPLRYSLNAHMTEGKDYIRGGGDQLKMKLIYKGDHAFIERLNYLLKHWKEVGII